VTLNGDTDYDGIGTLATASDINGDILRYGRINSKAPFAASIDLVIPAADLTDTDTDPVCYDATNDGSCDIFTIANIGGANLRFGRLVIGNEVSSEQIPLNAPLTAEYYNGTGYVVNTADVCTGIANTDLELDSSVEVDQIDATIDVSNAVGCADGTTALTVGPFVAGTGQMTFTAPGEACTGFTDISIDLSSLGLDHLLFDWDDEDGMNDGPHNDNPQGRATFGIISRPKEIIYTREPWN